MDDAQALEYMKRFMIGGLAGGLFIHDIENAELRDEFVLNAAREIFTSKGRLTGAVILRTTEFLPSGEMGLVVVSLNLELEVAHLRPSIVRGLAYVLHAQQLYLVSEVWVVNEHERVEGRKVSEHDSRSEAVTVLAEDPQRRPPLQSWYAQISRDAKGGPTLGKWGDAEPTEGRLTYLLPPEAYLAAGHGVPEA